MPKIPQNSPFEKFLSFAVYDLLLDALQILLDLSRLFSRMAVSHEESYQNCECDEKEKF